MTDHTELKRLAESLPQLPWSYEANGFILAWDGTERSRCENVGGFYYVCEGASNFREYLLALEPAKVLALIAENEELGRYLCTCRDCGGEGALHTGDWHSYGHMEPPEPVMEKCGECDGTGLLGEIQDLYQVITERDQLKAENERLRADYAGLARFNPEWDRVAAAQDSVREHMAMVVQLKAENAGLKTGYEAYERVNAELKAEVEGLRKLGPSKEIIWCACGDGYPVNSHGAGFMDANNGVCANCDAAMGQGEKS